MVEEGSQGMPGGIESGVNGRRVWGQVGIQ